MRQTTFNSFVDGNGDTQRYHVTYPEDYIFAHSRHTYITLDQFVDGNGVANPGAEITLLISDVEPDISYSEIKFTDQNGQLTFDIARYLQIFMEATVKPDADFDYSQASKLVERHYVYVGLKYANYYFFQQYFEVVNGADEVADCWWYGPRRLRWWYNYPFTFDFRNVDEASITKNNGASVVGGIPQILPDNYHYTRIRINPYLAFNGAYETLRVATSVGMGFKLGVLNAARQNQITLLGNACPIDAKHVYLRWLNRHGELSYWLFNRYSFQRQPKATDSKRAYIYDERVDENDTIDNAMLHNMTVDREIQAYSDELDGIDYEIVRQLFTAPFVDMMLPEHSTLSIPTWQRVHIKAEKQVEVLRHADDYTKNRQVSITLILPEEGQIFV